MWHRIVVNVIFNQETKTALALLEGQQQTADTTILGTEILVRGFEAMAETIIVAETPDHHLVGVDTHTKIATAKAIEVGAIVAAEVLDEASPILGMRAEKS